MKSRDQEVAQYFFFRQNLMTSSCATHYFVVATAKGRSIVAIFSSKYQSTLSLEENAETFIIDSQSLRSFNKAMFQF